MDKKVSIIVPVYNVEKYIEECIQSLLGQSYQNLEIILVDDASPDRCGEICDACVTQDSRIKVIHKANGGAASARNAGIDAATGDYICFVDSDDTVEKDYVQSLLDTLGNADIAMCGFFFRSRNTGKAECITPGSYDREGFMRRFLEDWSCALLWNKIFCREVIGDLRMEEGHRVDDEFFTYQVALNCRRVNVTDQCLYHYRMRSSSVMQDDEAGKEQMMLDRISYVATRYKTVAAALPQLGGVYFADAADTLCRYWVHSLNMPRAQKIIRSWVFAHFVPLLRMGRQGLVLLRIFLGTQPRYCGEPNPLQLAEDAYFD